MEDLHSDLVPMAELCNSLNQPGWFTELLSLIKQVRELRDEIRGREFADAVAYDGDIQGRFKGLCDSIGQCSRTLWKSMRRLRIKRTLDAVGAESSPKSADTESETYNTLESTYKTLKSMIEKCETAAHEFLRGSYNGKELDDIVQLMEKLARNALMEE